MILVTGGLGFIGSHIVVELLNRNYNVIVVDNLSNSKLLVKSKIEYITNKTFELFIFDICDKLLLEDLFKKFNVDTIIHLAGLKSVNQSIKEPLYYYNNNLISTLNLLELVNKYNINKFIFSSSATVYGIPKEVPLNENSQIGLNITNPYGKTKYMLEEIIKDFSLTSTCNFIILRYFNPVGAHISGLIGEDPNDIPNNLMPYILKVASNKYEALSIYGNDYLTPDGTCIRDFIHVVDLAKAHVKSIEYIINIIAMQQIDQKGHNNNLEVFNIGTGNGVSVLELVKCFINTNNIIIPFKFVDRREGDIPMMYANCNKANHLLGWKTELTIEDMCRDAFKFITTI
jgi:UDP-glucose 4-epimerase